MAQFVNMFKVNLKNSSSQIANINTVYQGNANANRVGAVVFDGDAPYPLTGTCAGAVSRDNGTFVPLSGVVSGNEAYVVLDSNCYEVLGALRITITVTSGNEETTLIAIYGNVEATGSGNIIQPAERLPDYVQLLGEIQTMRTATAAANTAATNANGATGYIAPTEASSTASAAHAKGTYFVYSGAMYEATTDIASGDTITTTGAGQNCKAVAIGQEIADVRSSLRLVDDVDLLVGGTRSNKSVSAGTGTVTFTWNAAKTECTIDGTNGGTGIAANYILGGANIMPDGMEAGGEYLVKLRSTDSNILLGFYFYADGTYISGSALIFYADGVMTIPSAATGVYVFIGLKVGATVSQKKIYDFSVQRNSFKAVDAKMTELSDQISTIKNALRTVEDFDLLTGGTRMDGTANTVTFVWNGDKTQCTVNGTNSSSTDLAANYILGSSAIMPDGMKAGGKYLVSLKTTSNNILLGFSFYNGERQRISAALFDSPGEMTVPENSTAIQAYVGVKAGATVSNDIISDFCVQVNNFGAVEEKIERQIGVNANAGIDPDADLEWVDGTTTTYAYGINRPTTTNDRTSCKPFLIPPGGAYVYYDVNIPDNGKKNYRMNFYHLENGTFAEASDYAYMMDELDIAFPFYIHYAENLYCSITYYNAAFDGNLHVSCGQIMPGVFDSIPYLVPLYTSMVTSGGVTRLKMRGSTYSPNNFLTYTRTFGCVLPLKDVRRIIAAPAYSLVAEIYEIDANAETVTYSGSLYSCTFPKSSAQNAPVLVEGLPILDLSAYSGDGYVIVGIISGYYMLKGSVTKENDTMGQLRAYDDVCASVAVEWERHTVVEHSGSYSAKVRMNIDTIKKHSADLYGFEYGNYMASGHVDFPPMRDSNFMFYNGAQSANCPFRNVSVESLYSAIRNPNSRMYKYYPQYNTTANSMGYGATCAQLAGLIAGYSGLISAAGIYYDMYRHAGITVRDIYAIDDVRTGDFLARMDTSQLDYGHIVFVTDIVRLNNVTLAAIAIEAYPPYIRYRAFINFDAFPFEENQTGLFALYSAREIGTLYQRAGRMDALQFRTFREAYGYANYVEPPEESTGVMCDRGTGAVYCIKQRCEISIGSSVENGETIKVYCGGTLAGEFDPATITDPEYIVNGMKIKDIASMLTEPGIYTLKTVSGATETEAEHFTVADKQVVWCDAIPASETTPEMVRVYFTNDNAEAFDVAVFFYQPSINNSHRVSFRLTAEDKAQGYCDIQRYFVNPLNPEETLSFDSVDVVFRCTDSNSHFIGTFHVLRYDTEASIVGVKDDFNNGEYNDNYDYSSGTLRMYQSSSALSSKTYPNQ